jgi:hypothetical protein
MHGAQPSSVHGLEISTAAREHPITILLRQRAWLPVYDRRLGPLIRPRSRSVLHAGKARTGLRLAGFPGVVLPRSQGQPCRCTCRCACSLIESWRMPRWRIRSFSTISRPLVCRLSNWSRRRPAGPGTPSVARSIRNGVEAACFSAPRRVPSLGWVLFRESEPGQHAQRGVGFRESKARLHCDLGRVSLPWGARSGKPATDEDKISSLGHAAGPPVDSSGHSMRHGILSRRGDATAFHSVPRPA